MDEQELQKEFRDLINGPEIKNPTFEDAANGIMIELAAKHHQVQAMQKEIEDKLIEIMPVEILEKQQDIKEYYKTLIESLLQEESILASKVKDIVIQLEKSVKNEEVGIHAVYVKPAIKWDNTKLEAMEAFVPQLGQARTIGSPSVRITFEK